MAEKQCYSVITKYGEELIDAAIAGGNKLIAKGWYIALGTGDLQPDKNTQKLINPIYDKNAEDYPGIRIENDPNLGRGAYLKYPFTLEGNIITELGLFDGNNKLVAAARVHDDLTYGYNAGNAEIIDKGISLKSVDTDLKIIVINPPGANPSVEEVQTMLGEYQKTSEKAQPNGYAPLDSDNFVPQKHLKGFHVPFCVNSGAITDGVETLLSIDGDVIKAQAPFTLTSAEGVTKTVTTDLTLDVSGLEDGEYTILFDFDTNSLEAFGSKIHIGKKFPDNAVVGDMLFNISVVPYKSLLKTETDPQVVTKAPIGLYARLSGGGGNSVSTSPYNENGVNKNHNCMPLLSTIVTDHVLEGDEAVGFALQGSLITKLYPDVIEKIKKQYELGIEADYYGIPCKRAPNGWYIADISQKAAVDELFAARGEAKIYVYDSVNERCYLTRQTTFDQFTLDTSLVNSFVEAGLPNIEGNAGGIFAGADFSTSSGALEINYTRTNGGVVGGSVTGYNKLSLDASASNSIYGNSDTVQPPSSLKLLYFKVGDTIVNESEINVSQVISELQFKADTTLDNITQEGKKVISKYAAPSGVYIFDIWAKGTIIPYNPVTSADGGNYLKYKCPANGFFTISFENLIANQGVTHLAVNNNGIIKYGAGSTSGITIGVNTIPVKKDDEVRVFVFWGSGAPTAKVTGSYFEYAEGEVPNA